MRTTTRISLGLTLTAASLAAGCHGPHHNQREQTMAEPREIKFIPRQVTIDERVYPYAIYVPDEYQGKYAWPAILFLNGSGERGTDGEKQTKVGIGPAIIAHPERFPCIVIMPQLQPDKVWHEPDSVKLAMACLEQTEADYKIDPDRIALTGLSLGGFGTWHMGALYPDRFCALGPICGGGDVEQARALAKTPIWAFHGALDPVVPADRSREMVAAVRMAGGDVRYTEFPSMGHNAWDAAYNDAEFIAWLLKKR